MSWTTDFTELFTDLVAEFGDTLTYQSTTMDCVKNPINSTFAMQLTNYEKQADTMVDIRRTDFVLSGLSGVVALNPAQKRPVVSIESQSYEVGPLENDDSANPIVRLRCRLLQ